MNFLSEQWRLTIPAALGALALWMLLPRTGRRPWIIAAMCGVVGVVSLQLKFPPSHEELALAAMFYVFAGGAVLSGVMMITDKNPVNSALWFAVATLATCGLFLLNSAPFLSAATIVVYAGAIVVTFVFVIMLAQQGSRGGYNLQAYQPTLATLGGFLLLASLLVTLRIWGGEVKGLPADDQAARVASRFTLPPDGVVSNPLSLPRGEGEASDLGSLRGVGRSLFGDYLFAVELGGTVLLIATIGAIALAPRRAQGHL